MNVIAIIPSRMASSRFPGKPLYPIAGKPMIGHVYDNVKRCSQLSDVIVATCDEEIKSYVESKGGKVIMTSNSHQRASDRCAEAVDIYETESANVDIVVMVQGDEPLVTPEMIELSLEPFYKSNDVKVSNLLGKLTEIDYSDDNCIKVVCDQNFNAMYMTRQAIPTNFVLNHTDYVGKQVCIIPFKRDYLAEYNALEQTPLEKLESIDMLRILECGEKVRMIPFAGESHPVDIPSDIHVIEEILNK